MFKITLVATFCVTATSASIAAGDPAGEASCAVQQQGAACAIQWDFVQAPRGFYQVEYLDETSLTWRSLGKPYSAFHSRSKPVQPGKLYRVRGCDDEAMTRRCVSSTVVWTIVRPNIDKIPDVLVDGSGVDMHVVKSAPGEVQIAQYNVYRLVQLLDRVPDLAQFPPMTIPQAPNGPAIGQDDDYQILSGIYENYNERRRQAMSND